MTTPAAVREAFKADLIRTIREGREQGVETPDIHFVLLEIANLAVMPEPPWHRPTTAPEPEAEAAA